MTQNSSILASIRSIYKILSRRQKLSLVVIVFAALATMLLEVMCAGVMVQLTQSILNPQDGIAFVKKFGFENTSAQQAIFYMGISLFIIYLIKNLISIMDVAVQNYSIRRMNCNFQKILLERFQKIDYEFFKTRHSSYGITVVSGDTDVVFSKAILPLTSIMTECLVFLGLIAVLAYLNVQFILFLSVLCFVAGFLVVKFGFPFLYALGQQNQAASLQKNINITKYFQGFKEILLSGKADYFIDEYMRFLRISTRSAMITNIFATIPRALIELLFLGSFVVSLLFINLEQSELGFLGAYAYAAFRIMPGLNRVLNHSANFKSAIPFIQRFTEEYNRLSLGNAYTDAQGLTFNDAIRFNDVSFSYKENKRQILSDINLTIAKGEFIGIIGETGSGKSTLLNLLLGLLKPDAGTILIDGRYPPDSIQWRSLTGYVPQSIYLIDGSIEENIAFGYRADEIDHERVLRVAQEAHLMPLLERLEKGMKTRVGEFGSALSGGEQQRIAIARALYKNPDVLVFDEATSALDQETERRIIETIHAVRSHRTVIMIAHRLESLRYCSRIIKVDEGKITEVGNYQDLKVQLAS